MERQKLIVANWKSNKTITEARRWIRTFLAHERKSYAQYVVCPPLPLVQSVFEMSEGEFSLGVQNLSPFDAGAYTGEVSGYSLQGFGVGFAILGHSERRKYLNETSRLVAQKVDEALAYDITPIVCVDMDYAREQADQLSHDHVKKVIIAYEPVHAISTFGGKEDPLETTLENIKKLRTIFRDETKILYGGSVDKENAFTYLEQNSIDGVLVGHASLDPVEFAGL